MKKLLVLLSIFLLVGCMSKSDNGLISYMEAKEQLINNGAVLVDVRTKDEYDERHIDGAILLTLDTIDEDTVSNIGLSKDKPVIVYCKSGNRSSQAVTKLEKLGYTKVYDLGSIDNWKE